MRATGVMSCPDARYVGEGESILRPAFSDGADRAVRARTDWRGSPEGSLHHLRRRYGISVIDDLARLACGRRLSRR